MTLALVFGAWWLLAGVLAAGIPFVLHLLSSVRAQEVLFPSLRFLRLSMEKTARRRRLQHWLLLVIRAILLAMLAVAVAEPISQAVGGWLSGRRYAAVVIVDNSFSMSARNGPGTRLSEAKRAAEDLLGSDDKPALAALLTTNDPAGGEKLSADLKDLRNRLQRVEIGFGESSLARRVAAALKLLENDATPRKAIYIFSDLQAKSFGELAMLESLARADDVHLFVIDTSAEGEIDNVSIAEMEITGRPVVDSVLEIKATLVNSSPAGKSVNVAMRIDGTDLIRRAREHLGAAGAEGSRAIVRFRRRFSKPGPVSGEIFLESREGDDIAADDVRRFSFTISGRIEALLVRGSEKSTGRGAMDPAVMLSLALSPYEDPDAPWSISRRVIGTDALDAAELSAPHVAFFCEAPSFTKDQARAVAKFVRSGGTAVFFLGPDVDIDNYNRRFLQEIPEEGGLLPGRIRGAIGEIGPQAQAMGLAWVDIDHPFLRGLHENRADYLKVLVQRYYPLAPSVRPGRPLMRLGNGDPLAMVKDFGNVRVVLFTTTASPRWSNLPITDIFLPMVARMSLLAGRELWNIQPFEVGAQVKIRPKLDAGALSKSLQKPVIFVTPPARDGETVKPLGPIEVIDGVARFGGTARIGTYRWTLRQAGSGKRDSGTFVVNPAGSESDVVRMAAGKFQELMRRRGNERVYVGRSVAEADSAAALHAQGRQWWDLLTALVIVLLVVEALVANRRRAVEVVPAHLNPRVAR